MKVSQVLLEVYMGSGRMESRLGPELQNTYHCLVSEPVGNVSAFSEAFSKFRQLFCWESHVQRYIPVLLRPPPMQHCMSASSFQLQTAGHWWFYYFSEFYSLPAEWWYYLGSGGEYRIYPWELEFKNKQAKIAKYLLEMLHCSKQSSSNAEL